MLKNLVLVSDWAPSFLSCSIDIQIKAIYIQNSSNIHSKKFFYLFYCLNNKSLLCNFLFYFFLYNCRLKSFFSKSNPHCICSLYGGCIIIHNNNKNPPAYILHFYIQYSMWQERKTSFERKRERLQSLTATAAGRQQVQCHLKDFEIKYVLFFSNA